MSYDYLNFRNRQTPTGIDRTVLVGNSVYGSPSGMPENNILIRLPGDTGEVCLSPSQLSRGCLLLGGTGSGKTNTLFLILDQLQRRLTAQDVMLIFDSKGDYLNRYFDPRNPNHIVISANLDHKNFARGWNIYGELFDKNGKLGESADLMVKEIARSLFKNLESSTQPFFHMAAADLFAAMLSCFVAEAEKTGNFTQLNNASLVHFITGASVQDIYDLVLKHLQFRYIQSYLGDARALTPQALGVLGFLYSMLSSQFIGPFKNQMPAGHFSMRRLIRERGAKTIFLEYDLSLGSTLAPIYSLLVDLAIKEALTVGNGNTYLICDEMHLLPYCQRFQDAVNYGRSKGLKTVIGLQSIHQLYNNYGEDEGKSIAAGFVNAICFHAADYDTRRFISERFGTAFQTLNFSGSNITREGFTVEDCDIHNLRTGEAFLDLAGSRPFKFRFKEATQ